MGQLRSGIESLRKTSAELEPKISELESQRIDLADRIMGAADRIFTGIDMLVMTIDEKFKQDNTPAEAQPGKSLKEIANPAIATVLKGIITGKAEIKTMIAQMASKQKTAADVLLATITRAEADCGKLTVLAEKKKAKWLKSAKYKAKIGGYLDALKQLNAELKDMAVQINDLSSLEKGDAWLERSLKISVDMTVKDIREKVTGLFRNNVKDFKASVDRGEVFIRKFRSETKNMAVQMAALGKWVSEADDMEKEADAA